MIVRNLRQVKLDACGYPTIDSYDQNSKERRFFVPMRDERGRIIPVYEYDLYFASSYRRYGTEHVRARDHRYAKRKIKKLHPNVVKFQWDDFNLE